MTKKRIDACQICGEKQGIAPKVMDTTKSQIRTLVLCDKCYEQINKGELVIRVIKK